MSFYPYFPHFVFDWMQFSIRGLRLMLLSVYEFGESWLRETVFFLSARMKSGVRVFY
jgi:hypothetical protein